MKIAGEQWKALDGLSKLPFEEQARADKIRYNNEMLHYSPPVTATKTKEGKRKRAKKAVDAPKGASSSYIIFGSVARQKILQESPNLPITEVSKIIGAQWRVISPEEKAKYEALSTADKERYQREMQQYRAGTYIHVPRVKKQAGEGGPVVQDVEEESNEDEEEDEEDSN